MEVKLKDIASFSKGVQINGDELLTDGKYAFLNGGIRPSGKWNAYNVNGNTITISEGGNSGGYINFMESPFWCGAHCYYLFDLKVDSKYLFYALKSQQNRIMQLRSGACMPNIKKGALAEFMFTIDNDVGQQRRVVAILDRLDDLIAKRQKQLTKLDELVKARFVEMFGDPTSNPKQWTKFVLDKRCEIITGNTPSRADTENYGSFIEWIKSDNINTPYTYLTTAQEYLSEKGLKKCRYVDSGCILMTCIAGSIGCIGNIAITDRTVAFNQQINAVVPHNDEVFYLYWMLFLSKPFIQSTINKALKGILSKSQLSNMEFPFPPRNLQVEFAAFCGRMEGQKLTIQQSLDKLIVLKKSLMQEYFG